jgi:DnaJ-class molecular chaperone
MRCKVYKINRLNNNTMFFNFPFGPGAAGPNVFFEMGDDGFSEDDFHHFNAGGGGGGNDIDNDKDYYKILGVDEKANEDEIKKAYRRMSMLHHPDKNGNTDESKQKFQELNNAYEVLSEANKRRTYDNMRRGGGGVGGGVPFGGQSFFPFGAHGAHGGGGVPPGFPPGIPEELLHMLFGGHGIHGAHGAHGGPGPKVVFQTFHRGRPQQPGNASNAPPPQQPHVRVYQVPETIIKTVSLTLEQCYNGCTIPLEIDRQVPDNDIVKIERETIHAQIPKGVQGGETIILNDCGHLNEVGMKGDVRIVINVLQHPVFKVENLDLIMERTISLKSALCGFDFEITHINGRVFKLANKPGSIIKPGNIKTIPGLGLEKNGETGVLKIKFNVDFPETLTMEQVTALQAGLP